MALNVVLLLRGNGADKQNPDLFVCLFIDSDKLIQEFDNYMVKQVPGSVQSEGSQPS